MPLRDSLPGGRNGPSVARSSKKGVPQLLPLSQIDFAAHLHSNREVVLTASGLSPQASRAGRIWAPVLPNAAEALTDAQLNGAHAAVFWREMDGVTHGAMPHMPSSLLYDEQKQNAPPPLAAMYESLLADRHRARILEHEWRVRKIQDEMHASRMAYHRFHKHESQARLRKSQAKREQLEDMLQLPCPRTHKSASRVGNTANVEQKRVHLPSVERPAPKLTVSVTPGEVDVATLNLHNWGTLHTRTLT